MIVGSTDPSYFVGWGTLALINAGLAQGKNFSGLLWFLGSLFLGPLATFFIVIMDKREAR
jgi:hypothetical protein